MQQMRTSLPQYPVYQHNELRCYGSDVPTHCDQYRDACRPGDWYLHWVTALGSPASIDELVTVFI